MRIAIGADHGGYILKESLVKYLKTLGHKVKDFGPFDEMPSDYPVIGYKVSKAVADKAFQRGILLCKSGIGMSMIGNKVKGARAALVDNIKIAQSSREHNDANILVFAASHIKESDAKKIARIWLKTRSLKGRHKRRVDQIKEIEKIEFSR